MMTFGNLCGVMIRQNLWFEDLKDVNKALRPFLSFQVIGASQMGFKNRMVITITNKVSPMVSGIQTAAMKMTKIRKIAV